MQTSESLKLKGLFNGLGRTAPEEAKQSPLGAFLFGNMRATQTGPWGRVVAKSANATMREMMLMALRTGDESEIVGIGKGLHRPYRVIFKTGIDAPPMTTRQAVAKTVHSVRESKRYCKSMDLKITGPEREILSFELDRLFGFDLVPPTIGRHVAKLGFASVQAWVDQPTAWEWTKKSYDYREDKRNPWLHRLAAFDFIRGEIDRHANNFVMDPEHRVYAIDNGYAFVKGDDRRFMKSSAGKHLVGAPIHPSVLIEIRSIDEDAVARVLQGRGFVSGEGEGVLKRIRQLKRLDSWQKLGDLW